MPSAGPQPDPLAAEEMAARAPVVEVLGHRMAVHHPSRDRYVSPVMARFGIYEPFLTELVLNEVRAADVALDLGAHIGYYTLLFARIVGPGGRVIALEPDPDNFALLRRNVALNGYANIDLFPFAAADRVGRRGLFRSADNAGDHRLYDSVGEVRPAVEVEAVPIDWLFRDRVGGVNFLKIDVQGSEGVALDGMTGLLARSPRVAMLIEFWPIGLERAGSSAAQMLERLGMLGFRVWEIDEQQGCIRRADPPRLLERFPPAGEGFTNLWCVKSPLTLTRNTPKASSS